MRADLGRNCRPQTDIWYINYNNLFKLVGLTLITWTQFFLFSIIELISFQIVIVYFISLQKNLLIVNVCFTFYVWIGYTYVCTFIGTSKLCSYAISI